MPFVRSAVIALLSVMAVSSSFAAEQRNETIDAMEVMEKFRVAQAPITLNLVLSSMLFGELVDGETQQLVRFANASYGLYNAFPDYKSAADEVRALLAETADAGSWPGQATLVSAVSERRVAAISGIADALKAMTDSTARVGVTLSATEGWRTSGLKASDGDVLYIKAQGQWTADQEQRRKTDWRGYPGATFRENAIDPQTPLGAVIFRAVGSDDTSYLGFDENGRGIVSDSGVIEFRVNDKSLGNNEGRIELEVYKLVRKDLEAVMAAFNELQQPG